MGLYSSRGGGAEYPQYYGYYEHDDYSTDIMSPQNYHGKHKKQSRLCPLFLHFFQIYFNCNDTLIFASMSLIGLIYFQTV